MNLSEIQKEQRPWVLHNFGGGRPMHSLLGVVEEVGELSHAHLKMEQGIRGTKEEHQAAIRDAVADIVIFLCDYCTEMGIDLGEQVEKTWAEVKKRDFKKYPKTGRPSPTDEVECDDPLCQCSHGPDEFIDGKWQKKVRP